MTLNVNRNNRDLAILWVGQQTDTDSRVPTAEELAAGEDVLRGHVSATRSLRPNGVMNRPDFDANGRQVTIPELKIWAAQHPTIATVPPHAINLPVLSSGVISRFDHVYLVVFSVVITAAQDRAIELSFQWRNGNVLESVTRENTARLRDVYGFWVSQGEMTPDAIAAALGNSITVDKTGQVYGTSRFYPFDANLLSGVTYALSDDLDVLPLLRVWRVQGQQINGYWWGQTAERSLEATVHLSPTYIYVGDGWESWRDRSAETLFRVMRGDVVSGALPGVRGVYNLLNGQVGANADAPGIATQSPNGSTALANGQRITFSNQLTTQTVYAIPTTTTAGGGGVAVAEINFAGNSPSGAQFAASGHKVMGSDGADISSQGTFAGGGTTGALTWTATVAGTPAVGTVVYLMPVLTYPAGSGFPVSGAIEKVYLNGSALQGANVREADLTGYVAPGGGDEHIVVMARANAALKWIYKKYTLNSDSSGVLRMPSAARGLIAWVNGTSAPTTRQDKAVVTDLENSTTYDILCYYPPTADDQWQFQILSTPYGGTKDLAYLDGATVATEPIAWGHTLGGGTTFNPPARSQPPGGLLGRSLSGQLPRNLNGGAVRDYSLDAAIAFAGIFSRAAPIQRLPPLSSEAGYEELRPGLILEAIATVDTFPESMGVDLRANNLPVGVYKPPLSSSAAYQLVVACGLMKDGDRRVLVMTWNGGTPSVGNNLSANTSAPALAGIDVFRYW